MKIFVTVLTGALVLRLFIAVVLVFTGDEAYYYFWGLHPSLAYYDHPAMVGWLLAPFAQTGEAEWWIRLPAVLLLAAIAWFTVILARPAGMQKALLAGVAVMLVPAQLLNVLTTTDTPVVLFSLWSLVAYQRALSEVKARGTAVNLWHWLAGVLLGAAFFSKYFAVLLGLGYLIHAFAAPRRERPWPGLLVVVLASMPWVALNLYANYEHCWLNILFNVYNRNAEMSLSVGTVASYLGVIVYMSSPILLWQLARRAFKRSPSEVEDGFADPARRIVLYACAVPLLAFGGLSVFKTIGLHWVFAFTPLLFVLGAYILDERALRLNIKYLGALSGLHLLIAATLWALPLETWSRSHLYDGLVLTVKPMEVLELLRPYRKDYRFATDGYSNSVTLSYQARRHHAWGPRTPREAEDDDFLVFGPGSAHGRQHDAFEDFRTLDEKNILIFRKTPPPPGDYDPFFAKVTYRSAVIRGVTYYLVLGDRFNYLAYRDQVLATVRAKFYRIPSWLPVGDCFFYRRYFAGADPRATAPRETLLSGACSRLAAASLER